MGQFISELTYEQCQDLIEMCIRDRCCMPICKKAIPKENFLTDTHGVACWLQHPMAPKVTPPAGIGGYDHE